MFVVCLEPLLDDHRLYRTHDIVPKAALANLRVKTLGVCELCLAQRCPASTLALMPLDFSVPSLDTRVPCQRSCTKIKVWPMQRCCTNALAPRRVSQLYTWLYSGGVHGLALCFLWSSLSEANSFVLELFFCL